MKRLATLLLCGLSMSAAAQWQLQEGASSLHFISVKNEHIAETHSFEKLSGSIDDNGMLSVSLPLGSVNTLIPIRDERMREHLFDVANNPSASFTAKLPQTVLSMTAGQSQVMSISGKLGLNENNVDVVFDVLVSRLNDNTLQATTIKPTIINAADFDLVEGISMLQSIAGLNSITKAVPVSFSVTFNQ
ncbi:YceI family protein [Aestuariibacter salexigens]|uniref:YceI family protein n=1 Tax=Aestuariibacter salexigens TaxID=226010 RepID=UPI00047E87D1|nr:YceI family protein [Aestuariibacter salexigens]